jgi:hypothetical protein
MQSSTLIVLVLFSTVWMNTFGMLYVRIIRQTLHEALRISLHEVGHTIACWSCSTVMKMDGTTMKAKHGGGLTQYSYHPNDDIHTLWARLIISLAGIAAETKKFACSDSTVRVNTPDMTNAKTFAGQLVAANSHSPDWEVRYDGPLHPFKEVMSLTDAEESVMRLAEASAHDIIMSYGARFDQLVDVLRKKKTIQEDDMEPILGDRRPIIWAEGAKAVFMVPDHPLAKQPTAQPRA